MRKCWWIGLMSVLLMAANVSADEVKFKKTVVDAKFRSEGVAVADFNNDGKMDIAVGTVMYLAPDWHMVNIAEEAKEYDPKGYSDSFWCVASDLNGDQWIDLIVNRIPGQATDWWENPGEKGGPWTRHLLVEVMSNENPIVADLAGDGRAWILCGWSPDANADSDRRRVVAMMPAMDPYSLWGVRFISAEGQSGSMRYDHGFGCGDVNGDGRNDVVAMTGWYEGPENLDQSAEWVFHSTPISDPCSQMIVQDFNGDGRADILSASAHNYGFWWHEQNEDGTFTTHEIDKTVSQLHSLEFVDIDGDGQNEAVLGKRWQAHWQGDPGWEDPAVLMYWDWECKDGQVTWTKHEIDNDSGVGIQFTIIDINGDGKLDIITSNKKGVFLFEQE